MFETQYIPHHDTLNMLTSLFFLVNLYSYARLHSSHYLRNGLNSQAHLQVPTSSQCGPEAGTVTKLLHTRESKAIKESA